MQIRVLGCSTSEMPNVYLSSFLVDGKLLFDAGTILSALNENECSNIKHIFISHAHLDHIKDLPFFAENIIITEKKQNLQVMSIPEVTEALRNNLFNNVLWPDYTKIPTPESPTVVFENMVAGKTMHIDDHKITAYKVNHTVPAVGYLVEDSKGKRLLYLGDSGPSNAIWESLNGTKIHGLIIEVSFPDKLMSLAAKTGHLTPSLLMSEIDKLDNMPENIFITHCKPQFKTNIVEELEKLNISNLGILSCGACFEI